MTGRLTVRVLLVGTILVINTACVVSAGPTSSAALSSTPVPPERTLFSGILDCGFPDGLAETTEGQITTYTGKIACSMSVSDPRASGEYEGQITMVYLDMPGYTIDKWWASGEEPARLTNAEGSWRSTEAFGSEFWDETDAVRTTGTEGYIGEGAYAGLTMRTVFAQGTLEAVDAYIVVGWIEPTE
jgi:hypothetical protein